MSLSDSLDGELEELSWLGAVMSEVVFTSALSKCEDAKTGRTPSHLLKAR